MKMPSLSRVLLNSGTVLAFLAAVFIADSYRYPPLRFGGGVTGINGKPGDEVPVGWNLQNTGIFPVRITEVSIAGYSGVAPIWTVGAVGTHAQIVGSAMSRIPQQDGYLLFPLGAFSIPPERSLPAWENATATAQTFKAPRFYGLITLYRLQEEGPRAVAQNVTLRYRYMGLPMAYSFKL